MLSAAIDLHCEKRLFRQTHDSWKQYSNLVPLIWSFWAFKSLCFMLHSS